MKRRIRNIFLVVLLGMTGLLIWPQGRPGAAGDSVTAHRCETKLNALEFAVRGSYAHETEITESEFNGYLEQLIERTRSQLREQGGHLALKSLNGHFSQAEGVVLTMAAAQGPLTMSYRIEGWPYVTQNRFFMDVRRASMGHLPMPGFLKLWLSQKMLPVFSQMESIHSTFDNLTDIQVGDGVIKLIIR